MKHTPLLTVFIFLALSQSIVSAYPVQDAKDQPDVVQVLVTVIGFDLKPLTGLPITISVDPEDWNGPIAILNENGQATIDIDTDSSVRRIRVRVGPGKDHSMFTNQEEANMINSFLDYSKAYHIDLVPQTIIIERGRTKYSVVFVLPDTVDIRGVVLNASGNGVSSVVFTLSGNHYYTSTRGGRMFTLNGLRRDAKTVLYLGSGKRVIRIPIDKETMNDDVDLGKITIPDVPRTSPIDMRLSNIHTLRSMGGLPPLNGVVLVHVDGDIIFSLQAHPTKRGEQTAKLFALPEDPLRIAPGEYYVVPGYFFRTEQQVAIIEAVVAKKDLTKTDIPRITVKEGILNEFDIDLLQAHQAIQEYIEEQQKQDTSVPAAPKPPTPDNP